MNTQKADLIEQLIDQRMSALVESYMGNPDGIPKEKIQDQLKKAYKDASELGWITKEEFQDLTHKEEIMESIPQEPKMELENTGKSYVPKVPSEIIETYELLIKSFEKSGSYQDAKNTREEMMKSCYDEVENGKINTIPQPDKIVGTGEFKPSKLENAVDKVMEGKETISVPKFKETVWQKIKNVLHIGKGHEARKQEHAQKFTKDNIKSAIPKDIIDKAKSIGAKTKTDAPSRSSTPPSNPVSKKRDSGVPNF